VSVVMQVTQHWQNYDSSSCSTVVVVRVVVVVPLAHWMLSVRTNER